MKLLPLLATLAIAPPSMAYAAGQTDSHELVWHPSGKTPAAIPRLRANRDCVPQVDYHKGSKGVAVVTNRCTPAENLTQNRLPAQSIARGE